MKKSIGALLCFSALAFIGCKRHNKECNCEARPSRIYQPTISKVDSIRCAHFVDIHTKYGWYTPSGMQFFQKDSNYYVAFVNYHSDSLIIVPILDSTTHYRANVKSLINTKDADAFLIKNDTLHIVDTRTKEYHQIAIGPGFTLTEVKKIDLFAFFPRKAVINGNIVIDKKISYEYPYLMLPYLTVGKKNYAGKKAVLKINLVTNHRQQMIDFPAIYHQCDYYWVEPHIFTEGKDIITVFPSADDIQVHDLETGIKKLNSSGHTFENNIICFDSRYDENLAYAEKYQWTNEKNINISKKGDKYYLFKRLHKNESRDTTHNAVLIFDKDLKYQKMEVFAEDVNVRLMFIYENKFAIYNYPSRSFFLYDL